MNKTDFTKYVVNPYVYLNQTINGIVKNRKRGQTNEEKFKRENVRRNESINKECL